MLTGESAIKGYLTNLSQEPKQNLMLSSQLLWQSRDPTPLSKLKPILSVAAAPDVCIEYTLP